MIFGAAISLLSFIGRPYVLETAEGRKCIVQPVSG